jgi:hypothetical protein
MITTSETRSRPLNIFERAECMVDTAGKGNLNFSIVSSYSGTLDSPTVQTALKYLQQMHPLLRVAPNSTETISTFLETGAPVPLKEFSYQGREQWQSVVKQELKGRFNKLEEPLWRVCLLKGEERGQLIVTFHHAIADAVCGMRVMNHLYEILAALLNDQVPEVTEVNTPVPDTRSLYNLCAEEPGEDRPIGIAEEEGLSQDFLTDSVDETTTQQMMLWSKKHNVRVHAILFAALMMSVRDVLGSNYNSLTAITAVNYRSSFKPAFSPHVLALMRTLIQDEFSMEGVIELRDLAKAINNSVHSQLDAGKHVLNLKALEKRLDRNATPQELLQRCKFPQNAVTQTNVGALEFSGNYPNSRLRLEELSFFADVTPFCADRVNVVLGTLTFRNKVSLSLWFLEGLVATEEAQAVLTRMKALLASMFIERQVSDDAPPNEGG